MSVILKWDFTESVDDLVHESKKEIFLVGNPGKIPFSAKVDYSSSAEHIEMVKTEIKKKIKYLFCDSIMKELYGISLNEIMERVKSQTASISAQKTKGE